MSQGDLKADECIFCRIIAGRAEASVVYEDALAVAFMDMRQFHSIGEAGGQEVPHLHFHVHPRKASDGMFAIYPSQPDTPGRSVLDALAASIARELPRPGASAALQEGTP